MTKRLPLPDCRRCETYQLPFGGLASPHTITAGYYDDGRIGEVFINGGKSGEMVEAIARDSAVILSLAIQHGVPFETIVHAITRNSRDEPQSIVGAVVESLKDFQQIIPECKQEEEIKWDAVAERNSAADQGPPSA